MWVSDLADTRILHLNALVYLISRLKTEKKKHFLARGRLVPFAVPVRCSAPNLKMKLFLLVWALAAWARGRGYLPPPHLLEKL